MESRNLIIAFAWTFILVSIVVLSWQGQELSFIGYLMFFAMGMAASIAAGTLMSGVKPSGSELQREVNELRERMDELNGRTQ